MAGTTPSPALGLSITGASGLYDTVDVTAPTGYTCYQFWIARLHSNNTHSDSYCQTSNVLSFVTSELGTYRVQAYGFPDVSTIGINGCCAGTSTYLGEAYINVQE